MRTRWTTLLCLLFGVSVACGSSGPGSEFGSSGGAGGPGSSGGLLGGGGDGGSEGGGGGDGSGCKKVDIVIAVDDSGSMREEKDAMRSIVFPAFAQRLRQVGGGLESYRIGVLDACPTPANYHTRGAGGECDFQSGKVWMESSSTALEAEFACVGDIVSDDVTCSGSNDDEQPSSAAAASLEPEWAGAGKPNEGFARPDALLVVIAITDEDEQPVPTNTAQGLYDRLVATKGDVRRMVFLGVGGSQSCSGEYGSAKEATLLKSLTQRFIGEGRGVFWDLCQGKLEDGLGEAMRVIEEACADFPTIN
jgi:hypothetical protein